MFCSISVPNLSSDIRWSIDLRYQSPRETWGYYDIVEGVVLHDEDGRVEKPNWDPLLNVHRRTKWLKDHAKLVEVYRILQRWQNVLVLHLAFMYMDSTGKQSAINSVTLFVYRKL